MSNQLYEIRFTKSALKDVKLMTPKMKAKLKDVLTNVIATDPFIGKKLLGDLKGNFSYRLNIKDRIIYEVDSERKVIFVKRARTHYGD